MELKIEHLSKQFKDKTAVNDVNLTLTPGVWGLLGANGAGKTTLMRMIADIMTPTNGAVYYDGKDIRELGEVYRSKFGFLPQDFGYHRDFTVKDYLEYMAALKDIPTRATTQKINHLLDILSLSDVKKKKISNLSGGMKRRVGIAQAMLNDPEILVMDEPTAGLDPGERVRLRNFISEFSHDRIVLISTHIVSDIEYISTRNAIMKAGEIVDVGTTAELVLTVLLISIVVLLMPLFAYVAMGATWLSTILPSAGIGMQNNFLSQLADFNYLNIGGMSFWTPHVILISAGIELFVFTFLAIHSYCRHQVA